MENSIVDINNAFLNWSLNNGVLKKERFNFWFSHNSWDIAANLKCYDGTKIILNGSSFNSIVKNIKKVLLFSDLIVLRDHRNAYNPFGAFVDLPNNYTEILQIKQPEDVGSVVVSSEFSGGNYEGSVYKSDKGEMRIIAFGRPAIGFHDEIYEWFQTNEAKCLLQSGSILFAPFLPSMDRELKLNNDGYYIDKIYDASIFDLQEYYTGHKLFKVEIPFIENITTENLIKVKEDHQHEWKKFMLFIKKTVNTISNNDELILAQEEINIELEELKRKIGKITKMRVLRGAAISTASISLSIATYLGLKDFGVALSAGGLGGALWNEFAARQNENESINDKPLSFLFKLKNA